MKVFISYASKDEALATRLVASLEDAGLDAWQLTAQQQEKLRGMRMAPRPEGQPRPDVHPRPEVAPRREELH